MNLVFKNLKGVAQAKGRKRSAQTRFLTSAISPIAVNIIPFWKHHACPRTGSNVIERVGVIFLDFSFHWIACLDNRRYILLFCIFSFLA